LAPRSSGLPEGRVSGSRPDHGERGDEVLSRNSVKIFGDTLTVARVISKEQGIARGARYFVVFRTRGFLRFLYDCITVARSRLLNRPVVHVVGDSHGKLFRWHRPFVVHHLGAATAHNLAKATSTTSSNRKLFDIIGRVSRKDIVMLVFGEIDCRIHLYYQYKKGNESRPLTELVDDTVARYGTVLEQLRALGIEPVVQGVPPATRVRNEYRYPFYAPPEVHSRISRMFNERLKAMCERNGYRYLDVHTEFSDSDGFMLEEYAGDEIHLNGKAAQHVKRELREKLGVKL
jgi:lysophospholipase L1-like esterase